MSDFLAELKQQVDSSGYVLVDHPLVEGIAKGKIPMRQIQGWAMQDSHYRRHVPRLSMLRFLQCTDPEIKAKLGGVAGEEASGSQTGSAGHYELFYRFAESIDISRQQIEASKPLPATAAHIYWAE